MTWPADHPGRHHDGSTIRRISPGTSSAS